MPTAKQHHDRLPPALLYYLARGVLPPHNHSIRSTSVGPTGLVEAFRLKHAESAAARAELLRTLWAVHADEIRAATPRGTNPWSLEALRSPDKVDDGADEQENPGSKTHDDVNICDRTILEGRDRSPRRGAALRQVDEGPAR